MEIISKNVAETALFAKKMAQELQGGDILALFGDLGSGKTTFTKALGQSLGVKKEITSPTFVIMKKYETGRKNASELVHIDCYRFDSLADAESIGFSEIIQQKNAIVVLEWPERVASIIENRSKNIYFEYVDENTRKIRYDIAN